MTQKPVTTQDCDRLLALGDQFLESWADDCGGDDSDKADYHECLADWEKARPLMAAAPDLLAALEAVSEWAEFPPLNKEAEEQCARDVATARAAIAKARGERLTIDCAALTATQKGA